MDKLGILPCRIERELLPYLDRVEELRLRADKPPVVVLPNGKNAVLDCDRVTVQELWRMAESAAGGSLYSCQSQLHRGYLSLPGGARLGICGSANLEKGEIRSFSDISSLCLRFPHEAKGCAAGLPEYLWQNPRSVLIVSPPGGGKTTLLRELVRLISDRGHRVGLSDERGEVAAVHGGVPQLDVGANTDVMTGVKKAAAAMMLLKCMSPQVIALDEITEPEDASACLSCTQCGVKLIATAHGEDIFQLRGREIYEKLLDRQVFSQCIVISRVGAERKYEVHEL